MPKKPKIKPKQIEAIARYIFLRIPVSEIVKKVKVSQSTVEHVRANYHAVFFQRANKRLSPTDYLTEGEYKKAEKRARIVDETTRKAIVKGVAKTIKLDISD